MFRILFFILSLFLCSCEHSKTSAMQSIPVSSQPLGAKVFVDGEDCGVTPLKLRLTRNEHHLITIIKEGFEPCQAQIIKKPLSAKMMAKALKRGYETANFYKNPEMGIKATEDYLEEEELRGNAFELIPQSLCIHLRSIKEKSS